MKTIYPQEFHEVEENDIPVFLIGPIGGTDDWQSGIIKGVSDLLTNDRVVFVNPRRIDGGEDKIYTPGFENKFTRQRDWELHYIEKALAQGVIVSWGAKQTQQLPIDEKGMQKKGYASTTRHEYGIFCGKGKKAGERLIVGIDHAFPEEAIISFDFKRYFGAGFKIHNTTEDLILAIVERIKTLA